MTLRRLAVLLVLAALPAAAGVNRWTEIGPPRPACFPNGADCAQLAGFTIDPFDERVLYVAITSGSIHFPERHGVWRSEDAGLTWTRLPLGQTKEIDPPVAMRVSPVDGSLYVITHYALFRSSDQGQTWTEHPGPANYVRNTDLALDPADAGTLYLAQENSCGFGTCIEGGVKRSDDYGASWRDAGLKKVTVSRLASDAIDPATLYAISDGHLHQTRNRGGSWQAVDPAGAPPIAFVVVDPILSSTVYAANGSIFKSTNRAQSWRMLASDSFAPGHHNVIGIEPRNSLHVLATNGQGRVIRSTDGGETWQPFHDGLEGHAPLQLTIGRNGRDLYAVAANGFLFHHRIAQPRRRAAGIR